MKPHPRIRKTVKWGGAAVTVLLVVVWIASAWFMLEWGNRGGWHTVLSGGEWIISYAGPADPASPSDLPGFVGRRLPSAQYYWPVGFYFTWHPKPQLSWLLGWYGQWFVPLWIPVLFFGMLSALAWRLDTLARRRARLNLCPTGGCNYDRTGLAAGAVCPECGRLPT